MPALEALVRIGGALERKDLLDVRAQIAALHELGELTQLVAVGAVRGGSRPAAFALLVLSASALFVALAIDLPDLNETGLIGRTYDQAEARPRVGFFIETLGATLALLGSIGTLLFKPGR